MSEAISPYCKALAQSNGTCNRARPPPVPPATLSAKRVPLRVTAANSRPATPPPSKAAELLSSQLFSMVRRPESMLSGKASTCQESPEKPERSESLLNLEKVLTIKKSQPIHVRSRFCSESVRSMHHKTARFNSRY